MLRFRPEVRIVHFAPPLADALAAATLWSLRTRVDVDVNSIDDPAPGRSTTTLHGLSLAVDLDTAGDVRTDLEALDAYLRRVLPPQYDVVFEGDHVHVEWDARRPAVRRS